MKTVLLRPVDPGPPDPAALIRRASQLASVLSGRIGGLMLDVVPTNMAARRLVAALKGSVVRRYVENVKEDAEPRSRDEALAQQAMVCGRLRVNPSVRLHGPDYRQPRECISAGSLGACRPGLRASTHATSGTYNPHSYQAAVIGTIAAMMSRPDYRLLVLQYPASVSGVKTPFTLAAQAVKPEIQTNLVDDRPWFRFPLRRPPRRILLPISLRRSIAQHVDSLRDLAVCEKRNILWFG